MAVAEYVTARELSDVTAVIKWCNDFDAITTFEVAIRGGNDRLIGTVKYDSDEETYCFFVPKVY